jgi:hypothetical protein
MTFKILYNAAVAMTGGQDAAGLRSVPEMTSMLMAEGVKQITITTDDPDKYRGVDLPALPCRSLRTLFPCAMPMRSARRSFFLCTLRLRGLSRHTQPCH